MDVNSLIEMANQIGDFFDSMPDREEALDDPTLAATIKPIVVEALEKHRMALMPVGVG